jgi:hypothetical protein
MVTPFTKTGRVKVVPIRLELLIRYPSEEFSTDGYDELAVQGGV